MPCIYLVYGALASRTANQIFSTKIRKLWKYYLLTNYIQNRDEKSEMFEWIPKNVSGKKRQEGGQDTMSERVHRQKATAINIVIEKC